MKVKFGNFELSGITIHFAYEGQNIWISVASMSDFIAGGPDMGVSAGFMVTDAQTRKPHITNDKAVKLPIISGTGEPSKEYHWYYRIDLDIAVFGLHPEKILAVEKEIHEPLIVGLSGELDKSR